MADLKRLDSLTEYQLTNAIQKAASKALASQDDRSEILAKQLTEDNIPKHLTKTATQAFNRRISVITIGKRGEDTKADDFPLADFNKVASLRGCDMEEMKKKASLQTPFVFKIEKPAMKKAASVAPAEEPVYNSPDKVMKKFESYMAKEQTEFLDRQIELSKEMEQLERMVKKASEMIDKDIRVSRQLATIYGDTYQQLFSGKVNPEALKKSAAYAVLPKSPLTEYVQKTIEQADVVSAKTDLLMLKKASVERVLKEMSYIEPKLKEVQLDKKAAAGYTMLKDIAANSVSVPINALLAGAKGAAGKTEEVLAGAAPFLNPEKSVSPDEILSLELLSNDRYQDKRMRLIDMLSNPDFSDYPVRQIEKAVEDTIATNPNMASPRYREYLKSEVAARLLAGNRTNRADQAAVADILKKVTESDKNLAEQSAEKEVSELAEKRYGGDSKSIVKLLPTLSKELDKTVGSSLFAADLGADMDQLVNEIKTEVAARQQIAEDERKDRLEAVKGYLNAYNKLVEQWAKQGHNFNKYKLTGSGKRKGQLDFLNQARQQVGALPKSQLNTLLATAGSSSGSKSKSKKKKGTP